MGMKYVIWKFYEGIIDLYTLHVWSQFTKFQDMHQNDITFWNNNDI